MKALDSLGKRACDGLFPLPAEENAMFKHLLKALESLGKRACDVFVFAQPPGYGNPILS